MPTSSNVKQLLPTAAKLLSPSANICRPHPALADICQTLPAVIRHPPSANLRQALPTPANLLPYSCQPPADLCQPPPAYANVCRPVRTSANLCVPLPTSANFCHTLLTCANFCLPPPYLRQSVLTSAHLYLPWPTYSKGRPSSLLSTCRNLCQPLLTFCAELCLVLRISFSLCQPLPNCILLPTEEAKAEKANEPKPKNPEKLCEQPPGPIPRNFNRGISRNPAKHKPAPTPRNLEEPSGIINWN